VGRPRTTWSDCVLQDLEDFGFGSKADLLSGEGWLRVKELTLERDSWRVLLKTNGMEYALNKWYVDQTTRRTKTMVRLGVELEYCEEPKENVNGRLPVGDDDREDEVGYDYNDVYVDEYSTTSCRGLLYSASLILKSVRLFGNWEERWRWKS
jgi:hypothetical protein